MVNQVTLQFPGYADLGLRTAPERASARRFLSTDLNQNDMLIVGGGSSAGDGQGGIFVWINSSIAAESASVIKPDDLGPSESGRWIGITY